jgi:mannosyltransferase OCH1-like enzyme
MTKLKKSSIRFFRILMMTLIVSPLFAENDLKNLLVKESLLFVGSKPKGFIPVSFWESMAWKRTMTPPQFFEDPYIKLVEENFNKFCIKSNAFETHYEHPSLNSTIPPIIHFIWLGSSVPEKVKAAIESWRNKHSGWEIMIWTDSEVNHFHWSCDHSQLGFEQADTWAEKADILRLELLYQFGGIYSDTDVLCFKSFNDLIHHDIVFFAGLEMNLIWKDPLYIGTAVLGAIKGSSIIKYCIDNYKTKEDAPELGIIFRAGPGLASCACREALMSDSKDHILILPCSYLYPLPYFNRWISDEETSNYIAPESFTLHLWDGSWCK